MEASLDKERCACKCNIYGRKSNRSELKLKIKMAANVKARNSFELFFIVCKYIYGYIAPNLFALKRKPLFQIF